MRSQKYPKINIRSKNELAKRISGKKLSQDQALDLINDVLENKEKYWRNHPKSNKKEDKWIRDASFSNYGKLLRLINDRVLAPYDSILPSYIYGGVRGKNHKMAANSIKGKHHHRTLLKMDLKRFYEQNKKENVREFLAKKCGCGKRGSKLLADLCCVPIGPKENPGEYETIGRGFATSMRLAIWCNIDAFRGINRIAQSFLCRQEPLVACFVDDVGITARRSDAQQMTDLYEEIANFLSYDVTYPLILNKNKSEIIKYSGEIYDAVTGKLKKAHGTFEYLGLQMLRSRLTLGMKTNGKIHYMRMKHIKGRKRKALLRYKSFIEK